MHGVRSRAAGTCQGRDMRRLTLTIAIFLLAGAVVNVAVAWACAVMSQTLNLGGAQRTTEADRSWWKKHAPPGFALDPQGMHHSAGVGKDTRHLWETYQPTPAVGGDMVVRIRAGWPALTLEGAVWQDGRFHRELRRDLLKYPGFFPGLPLRPIWPGLVVNTVIYAVFLWALSRLPFAVQRYVRVRRGLCPACGYDLRHGEHEACPECGVTA